MIKMSPRSSVLFATLSFAAACSGRSGLKDKVANRCSETQQALEAALKRSREGKNDIVGLDELADPNTSVRDLHRLESKYLSGQFSFCLDIRKIDKGEYGRLRGDYSVLDQDRRESADHTVREKALEGMLILFSEIDRLPLID